MRPSSKDALVAAAVEIVHEEGYQGLTFEALGQRTGLTRSGIVYHFPQREMLVEQVCTVLAAAWDKEIAQHLNVPVDAASPLDRARAYLDAALRPANPELFLLRAGPTVRALERNPWAEVISRWVPARDAAASVEERAEIAHLRTLAEGCYTRHALEGDGFDVTQLRPPSMGTTPHSSPSRSAIRS